MAFDALVMDPGFGSMWLSDVHLCDGVLTGSYLEPIHWNGDESYSEELVAGFPLSCLRKLVRSGAPVGETGS
jgi:hypothetical protein